MWGTQCGWIAGSECVISQAVEYSLRAMALLAQHSESPLTVQYLAAKGQIPGPYLAKLLQGLVRGGLVRSQRGVGGGYSLSRSPDEITMADVVNAIEPLQRIRSCPLGLPGHIHLCPLHRRLDQTLALVEEAFQQTRLSDLFRDTQGSTPLCDDTNLLSIGPPRGSRGPNKQN